VDRMDGNAEATLEAGDAVEMLTPGGGGWGARGPGPNSR